MKYTLWALHSNNSVFARKIGKKTGNFYLLCLILQSLANKQIKFQKKWFNSKFKETGSCRGSILQTNLVKILLQFARGDFYHWKRQQKAILDSCPPPARCYHDVTWDRHRFSPLGLWLLNTFNRLKICNVSHYLCEWL